MAYSSMFYHGTFLWYDGGKTTVSDLGTRKAEEALERYDLSVYGLCQLKGGSAKSCCWRRKENEKELSTFDD